MSAAKIAQCITEQRECAEYLAGNWLDKEGAMRGTEDWLMEECILRDSIRGLTPFENYGGIWLKRDDYCLIAGVRGGKARTCWVLSDGASGLVTAGSRHSPQVAIVAHIARDKSIPCRVHVPAGPTTPMLDIAEGCGAVIKCHRPGYNTVIVKRASDDAQATGLTEIPFGMECKEAVNETRRQVVGFPSGVNRLVVPVGSGMSLAGILWGLEDIKMLIPVLGVRVGADPTNRLDKYAPATWRFNVELRSATVPYHRAGAARWRGVSIDQVYEGKCVEFLEDGDCLWIVGIRPTGDK